MIRISNILDDMLVLDSVVKVVKKRLHPKGYVTPRLSSRFPPPHNAPPPIATPPSSRLQRSYSFDSPLASPICLDRVRMSPSPRKRNRKKPVRRTSFIDLTAKDSGNHINTIFETQEVMLHNACNLIRMLVQDNAKVMFCLLSR